MLSWLRSLCRPAPTNLDLDILCKAIEELIRDLRIEEKILRERISSLEQLLDKDE